MCGKAEPRGGAEYMFASHGMELQASSGQASDITPDGRGLGNPPRFRVVRAGLPQTGRADSESRRRRSLQKYGVPSSFGS